MGLPFSPHWLSLKATFITEWEASEADALLLLDGKLSLPVCRANRSLNVSSGYDDDCHFFADKMIAIAKYYGFDGWFFNIECTLTSPRDASRMASFLEYMREASKRELGDGAITLWYDSVTSEGVLKYLRLPFSKLNLHLDKIYLQMAERTE